jgi:hypothetical protein
MKKLAGFLAACLLVLIGSQSSVIAQTFTKGDIVEVYNTGGIGLRVRNAPCGDRIGNEPDGSIGIILEGPIYCVLEGTGYYWWRIRWSDGMQGWSAQNWLRKLSLPWITSASPSPSTIPPGGTVTLTYNVTNLDKEIGGAIAPLLGASIQLSGGGPVLSDPANDRKATIRPGSSSVSRPFIVPATAAPGTYDLLVSLVADVNNNGRIDSEDRAWDLKIFPRVLQVRVTCTYSIFPTSQSFSSAGGSGSVNVTAPSGCPWTATSNASWITITSGSSGNGNGTVNYSVASNPSTTPRTGTMTIAGQTFTVTQDPPPPGTIQVNATLNGATWSGSVSYRLTGPQTIDGTTVPATFSNRPTGSYTLNYQSGGPSGATLTSITPSATQTLNSGGTITFTLNFTATGDTMPPDTQITGGPNGTINTNSATFTWTGSDNVTPTGNLVYAYRLDPIEPNFSSFSSTTSKTYSMLANGSYTFYVKARDQAGNEDPTPASRSFTVNVSTPTFSISGQVTSGGSGLSGVTMRLSGAASIETTTDSNGNYSFTGLSNGNYTVTPSKANCTFSPTSRSVTISGSNVTSQDFTANCTPPGTPRIVITAPGRDTILYITHDNSGTPRMPSLNASAQIAGLQPDPTAKTNFYWTITISYTTRQRNSRLLTETFKANQIGGQLPSTIFGTAIRGGDVKIKVEAILSNGQKLSAEVEGPVIRAGDNPAKEFIRSRLNTGDAEETSWLQRIACQESGQQQFFLGDTDRAKYSYKGEPLMNKGGDGGAGIMQITKTNRLPDGPRLAELWDWRANVDEGKRTFADKISGAWGYPNRVSRSSGFKNTVNLTNQWRRSQGLQPLQNIFVPAFTREQVLEDAVRGYNGWAGKDQFGLELHEFRLKTRMVKINGVDQRILEVTNERRLGSRLVADAIWERVPASERPQTIGDPNYVEKVRSLDPITCERTTFSLTQNFNITSFFEGISNEYFNRQDGAQIRIEIFDLRGYKVFDSGEVQGSTLTWDFRTTAGRPFANGVYLYVISVRGFDGSVIRREVKKLIILR